MNDMKFVEGEKMPPKKKKTVKKKLVINLCKSIEYPLLTEKDRESTALALINLAMKIPD